MKTLTRAFAAVLCFVMLSGIVPVAAFAATADLSNVGSNVGMTTASTQVSALAPGVTETEVVAYDKNGDRVAYFVVNANIATNPDVQVKANYHDNDNTGVWGKASVIEQANAATEKRGYNVVATTNASYYNVSTGQPSGGFVMEGVNVNGDGAGNSYPFFAIMKDGTAMIGQKGTFSQYSADIQEAVGGWQMLVWDGQVVATNDTTKYPRSTVGVKANGDVVLMLADGNQKPYSAGLTYVEQAQIMVDLGCVAAIELDGGGSATYAAKLEGTDEVVLRSSPCDGTIRSVSNSLMVISTAVADGTFDHANLSTEYPFYAPTSKVDIIAYGADKAGQTAEIPENITWTISDDSFGTIADGTFVSNGKLGTVTVQMLYEGAVVGSIDVTIVHPTEIAFAAEEKMIPYGKPSDFTVTALYNGADMFSAAEVYDFVCTAGTMNGFVYTAPEEGAGATATVTATYKYADIASDVIKVEFGKGSDILFDFEGGEEDAKYWGDYFDLVDAAERGDYTNGYSPIYETANGIGSNKVEQGIHENVFLATKENGHVYSGDYSLAYTVDYRYSTAHANWQYAYLYYWGDPITLLDTEKGIAGTRLGMWMYIPEEAVGSCARFAYTYKDATGKLNTAYLYFTYMYVEKGFSKLTSEKIPEAGWAYVYVDMKQISNTYVSTSYYKDENGNLTRAAESNYAPAFIQFIVSSSATGAEKVTFYIDDITLDYSDAVDDRDMPIISDPLILEDQDSFAIDGRTLNYNTITVTASAAEDTSRGTNFTGLNEATAQVYIDGHKVPTKFAAGKISATGIKLPNGTHDITFEIADKQGNYTKLTRQIVIAAESDAPTVTLQGVPVGVKADGKLYTGGQYNILLNTDKVEGIDSINFKLWLNSASEWALDEMMVLNGFKVEYVLDENSCTADITVTRVNSNAIGAATLLTLPVYAWSWNEELGGHDASTQWNSKGCAPQITVSYKVKYGNVEYTEKYDVDVAGFSNVRVDAKTELDSSIANLKNTIKEWHYHAEVAIADLGATCTTDGYTGRTQCSVCKSILNWGTVEKATGHDYTVVGETLACHCGDVVTGTGLQILESGRYYMINGVLIKNRWIQVGDAWYCFRNDYKAYTGNASISGRIYNFGETGAITEGQWFDVDGYHRYYIGPNYYSSYWGLTIKEINGVEYGFDEHGDIHRGYVNGRTYAGDTRKLYLFDENGVRLPVPTEPTIITLDGVNRYINGGELQANVGLVKVGNDYYYVRGSGELATGTYHISNLKSNGLGFVGYYDFDETGKLILKNGIIDGYYYIDGVKQAGLGLVKVGSDYYYITGSGLIAKDLHYISEAKSNGLGYVGYYQFDETTGKLLLKNGIDGDYYYVDGEKQAGLGLVKVGSDYYYITGSGLIAKDLHYISEAKSNGLGYVGYYQFDETTGKLLLKNGIDGDYYYVDGVKQAGLGLVKVGSDYYYITGSGLIAKDLHYISEAKSNGLGYVGYYQFDEATGKLLLKNGIDGDYYYVDGEKQAGLGLVKVGSDYYYITGSGLIAKDLHYISEAKSNGLGFVGYYDFDETGKLTLKNGIVNGYYYIDGVKQTSLGLIQVGDDYYYVRGSGALATGTYYISELKSNGLGFVGSYQFDENGKMIR